MVSAKVATVEIVSDERRRLVLDGICTVLQLPDQNVDHNASFISLGGDSLTALSLSIFCKKRSISLPVPTILQSRNIKLLLGNVGPTALKRPLDVDLQLDNGLDCAVSLQASDSPRRKRARTTNSDESFTSSTVHITDASLHGNVVLTEMQLALMHGSRVSPGSNIISFIEEYRGEDLPIMKKAWNTVITSEPIFRIYGSLHDDQNRIEMHNNASVRWVDVVTRNQDEYNAEINRAPLHSFISTSFKVVTLDRGMQESSTSTIIWRVHHAMIDGWSASCIYQKVRHVAEGHIIQAGTPFTKIALDLLTLQESSRNMFKKFWAEQRLQFPSPATEIVVPSSNFSGLHTPCERTSKSITLDLPLDEIKTYVQNHDLTPAALYYSAWALVLSIYADSDTVMFGIVTSGRNLPLDGADDTIGPLINTIPFNRAIDREQVGLAFLQDSFRHMILLGSMQCSAPVDGFSRNFSSVIAQEIELTYTLPAKVRPISHNSFKIVSDVPLSILIHHDGNVRLCYQSDKYQSSDMESLCRDYQRAICALLKPLANLQDCFEMLLEPHRERLLNLGNCKSPRTFSSHTRVDLVTLFESVALLHPTTIALQQGDHLIAYSKLQQLADRLAQELRILVRPGECVCVHADRSIYWIVAIYGILKAGAVYAPLDPTAPAAIRDVNFRTVSGKIFLAPRTCPKGSIPASCSQFLSVEDIVRKKPSPQLETSKICPRASAIPDAPAYVCFTSGTTGKPKPVLCTHKSLVSFQRDEEIRLFAKPGVKISQIMSPSFDGSIHEVFSALSYGATLVLADPARPFEHLGSVNAAILTPSLAKVLSPSDYPNLQNVYLIGEPVPQVTNDAWSAQKAVYNMYGPTEATCGATIKRLRVGVPVSLGRPNPSTRVYILDRYQRLLPQRVTGEIFLAGVQVARGYIDNIEETTSRFLEDSVCTDQGERMYRTGDIGYWDASGELVCLGRRDRQIKMSGFRLDLNDLEVRILNALPKAKAVAVIQKEDFLVAVVQPSSLASLNLREIISQFLPRYALPRSILAQDTLPLTTAGKLDYAAIARGLQTTSEPGSQALKNPTEQTVADAWRKVLKLDPWVLLDRDSDFIALGGHSMLQFSLASHLTQKVGREIPVKLVMTSPRLRDLAQAIDQSCIQGRGDLAFTVMPPALGRHGVSPMEYEWWQQYQACLGTSSFNVSSIWKLDPKKVDRRRLLQAWNFVIARHEVLRSRFVKLPTGLKRHYGEQQPRARLARHADLLDFVNRPFELDRDHLIRVVISKSHMLVCISHIICDLSALQVLFQEVRAHYTAKPLKSARPFYTAALGWSGEASPSSVTFWREYLTGVALGACKTNHSPKSLRESYNGTTHAIRLPRSLFHKVIDFSRRKCYTLHQIALSAVALACTTFESGSTSSQSTLDFVAGSPYFNRPAGYLATVGLFLSPLPIRIRFRPTASERSPSSSALVNAVQRSSQDALAHAVSWPKLVQLLGVSHQYPNYSLFNTMVTFHDERNHDAGGLLGIEGCEQLLAWAEGAKFRLMCEFSALNDDCCVLRLEYDTQIFNRCDISCMGGLVVAALEGLVEDEGYEELWSRLNRLAAGKGNFEPGERVDFGTRVASLY